MKNPAQNFRDTRLAAHTISMTKDALVQFAHHNPTATLSQLLEAIRVEPQSVVDHLDSLAADAARYRYLRRKAIEAGDAASGGHLSTPEFDTHCDLQMQADNPVITPIFPRKR